MVEDVSKLTTATKVNDFLARLESRNTRTAMAAEAELSMVWAISEVADVIIEPSVAGGRRPDALSRHLFRSRSAVIEVRALSDDSFSGREAMVRTANIIASTADRMTKQGGSHLAFEFLDHSYWDRRYHRERCVDPRFEMSPSVEGLLREWIAGRRTDGHSQTLRIKKGRTDVILAWCDEPARGRSVFCRMPPVAYDLEDNPIYKALKKKSGQLRDAGEEHLRVVFLFDAGCELLRYIGRSRAGTLELGGDEIVLHCLRKLRGIDVVCVFSPFRERQLVFEGRKEVVWNVTCSDRRVDVQHGEYRTLESLASKLPRARFEGYQARQTHRQGGFLPDARGWYNGTTIRMDRGLMKIRISARLLLEYLAGRLDAEHLRSAALANDENMFEKWLKSGMTIQGAKFEGGGLDVDDDYIVLEFGGDWGARPLRDG